MSGNKNSGRKAKEGGVRTSVLIDAEIYNYLNRHGNVSAEIERITREDMGTNADTKNIKLHPRSKIGFGYTCWTPEHPEPPTKPDHTGTFRSIWNGINADRTYQSLRSGGTYLTTAWFTRANGQWHRIVEGNPADLDYLDELEVTIE